MLVLSRRPGERVLIGDGIEVMVVAVNGNRVRLGIAAPCECRILRAECRDDSKPHEPQIDVALLAGCGV